MNNKTSGGGGGGGVLSIFGRFNKRGGVLSIFGRFNEWGGGGCCPFSAGSMGGGVLSAYNCVQKKDFGHKGGLQPPIPPPPLFPPLN